MNRFDLDAVAPTSGPNAHDASGEGYSCHFCDLTATSKFRRLVPGATPHRRRVRWLYTCAVCRNKAEREVG